MHRFAGQLIVMLIIFKLNYKAHKMTQTTCWRIIVKR